MKKQLTLKQLQERIDELEKQVRELHARPVYVPVFPNPYSVPNPAPNPYPTSPWYTTPIIYNGDGFSFSNGGVR